MLQLELPWPPSINHYWRHTKNGHYISADGRAYRETVFYLCLKHAGMFSEDKRLSMTIDAFPPDKRKRDLDNILKCLLDSLQHAGVYHDDSQIDSLIVTRKPDLEGRVLVTIKNQNGISSS